MLFAVKIDIMLKICYNKHNIMDFHNKIFLKGVDKLMTNKQKATDFLDKCRVISASEQVIGIFVEVNGSGNIIIRNGFIENGKYDVEDLDEFSPMEIFQQEPHETVLTFNRRVRDCIGKKRYHVEVCLYNFLKELNGMGCTDIDDEAFEEDNY